MISNCIPNVNLFMCRILVVSCNLVYRWRKESKKFQCDFKQMSPLFVYTVDNGRVFPDPGVDILIPTPGFSSYERKRTSSHNMFPVQYVR